MTVDKDFREEAESHWKYTEKIIESVPFTVSNEQMDEWNRWRILCKLLYVEAMVHGYKHGVDDS